MLDEAREKIDSRLSDTQRKVELAAVQPPPAAVRQPASPFATSSYSFGGEPVLDEDVFDAPLPVARTPEFETAAFPAVDPEPPGFDDDDYETADGFAGQQPAAAVESFSPAPDFESFAPPPAAEPARTLSTREVIEQARAAARAAAAVEQKTKKDKKDKSRDHPARPSLFSGFGSKASIKSKRRVGSSVTTALMVFGIFGALGGGTGLLLLPNGGGSQTPDRVAQAIAGRKSDVEIRSSEADTAPGTVRAAVALAPQLIVSTPTDAVPTPAQPPEDAQALFDQGVLKIEAKDRSGVEIMRKAANLGLPRAQFYLGKMYETGEGGVKKDLVEARRWTERAATSGDPRAMHNLALFYFKGEGGAKNSTTAANWFRKAADQGLVDSQFNLAQLYEGGWGVSQNPAEAYKWYVIAGRAGDATSKARAAALRPQLTAEAQRTADRSAVAFRAQTVSPAVAVNATSAPASADLGTAQRVLSQLGYYQGPRDGVSSPGLRMAISAYQRDQGLPSSGALDAETLNRLSVYAR
jgi:localization factor PodJL